MLPLTANKIRLLARGSAAAASIAIPRRMVPDQQDARKGEPNLGDVSPEPASDANRPGYRRDWGSRLRLIVELMPPLNLQCGQPTYFQKLRRVQTWVVISNQSLGELAQLVERCDRTAEVRGSNPLFSTFYSINSTANGIEVSFGLSANLNN